MPSDAFHRFGEEYYTRSDWGKAIPPDARRRIALALGPEPLPDARYLLPAVRLERPAKAAPLPDGPDTGTQFIVDAFGERRVPLGDVLAALTPGIRADLDFPRVWGRPPGTAPVREAGWFPLPLSEGDAISGDLPLGGVALTWPLTGLVSEGAEAARDLARYTAVAGQAFAPLGWDAVAPREAPDAAAARAAALNRIKGRFAQTIEMRLAAAGKPFPSRDIWRAAYALGLTWGAMDLFHWSDPVTGTPLFTLSSLGQPGYFLPERAAEGERVPGIALGFELPTAPAPLETYDRMAVAMDYLRHRLGGRTTAPTGADLDADRLYADRDALAETITQMRRAGISPGSPEAARYF